MDPLKRKRDSDDENDDQPEKKLLVTSNGTILDQVILPENPDDAPTISAYAWLITNTAKESPIIAEGDRKDSLPDLTAFGRADKLAVTEEMREAWIRTDRNWEHSLGDNRRGVKVLGMGGMGIAGLWQRIPFRWNETGSARDSDMVMDWNIRHVVIKQQQNALPELENEGKLLVEMVQGGAKHVLGIYHNVIMGAGQGTIERFDEEDKKVGRMYLEYCEGEDFINWNFECYKKYSAANSIPEKHVWKVMKCLALGLVAIEHGTEDLQKIDRGETWKRRRELTHFDIKPANGRYSASP
ncbi:hypothetical protein G7Y89_g11913 [Cudoniella acicularis]|uniref:Protein kinase domain-containing protein n=1 Tax=Cudoniella acicularis TaxID=354080 RepID=A0A8H4VXV5_9HELO|nr:hypothetical protein G7Y89_g11913 [Cudoniella acicularis]